MNHYNAAAHAYQFPLTIKQLLNRSKVTSQNEEIVYADKKRMTYTELFSRIGKLANVLDSLNLDKGDVVAVMDWDSHRFWNLTLPFPCRSMCCRPSTSACLQTKCCTLLTMPSPEYCC